MKKAETVTMTIRVPISVKVQIDIAAHRDSRTVNSWVNKIIQKELNAKK